MSGLIKYRVHEVAKDFNMTSKEITQILTDYATTPKNHMQVLEDAELNDIFEYLTQHHQAASLEELYKVPDQPKAKPQAASAEAPKSGAAQQPAAQTQQAAQPQTAVQQPSQLGQWPCQIKLVPVNAPYFQGAKLLIAADCTAYAYANMHSEFMKGKITLIGCPKLDAVDYTDKLTQIIRGNDIQSVTIVRMEVPCCGGLEHAAREALRASGKFLPWQVVTISVDGKILDC